MKGVSLVDARHPRHGGSSPPLGSREAGLEDDLILQHCTNGRKLVVHLSILARASESSISRVNGLKWHQCEVSDTNTVTHKLLTRKEFEENVRLADTF